MSDADALRALLVPVLDRLADVDPGDAGLAGRLNAELPVDSPALREIRAAVASASLVVNCRWPPQALATKALRPWARCACLNLRIAFNSIWRMRSRVRLNRAPISSREYCVASPMP